MNQEERLDRLEGIIATATQSLAAITEAFQARLPFYVSTSAAQSFVGTTSGKVSTLTVQPLAAQLVRVTGLVAVAVGTTAAQVGATTLQLGNGLLLPVPPVEETTVSAAALILPVCSIMLDVISQGVLALNCTAGDTHNMSLALWLWGEQQPTTGMVS